jgi:hypothetical protein
MQRTANDNICCWWIVTRNMTFVMGICLPIVRELWILSQNLQNISWSKIQQDAIMYQNSTISYLYEAQHVSGDTPPIIRSLKLHWRPLVFHTWKVGGRCQAQCVWQRPPTTRPTTFHVCKTRGCRCSFRLLIMGGVSSETYWASYK